MEIEIFDAIGKIGGNKIFIHVADKKFLFDFGLSFHDNGLYYAEFLRPRKFNGLVDYLNLELIPSINNLYRNDALAPFKDVLENDPYKLTPSEKNDVSAFFLTHAHVDHYNFVGFLKQDTPFYMNWITKAMLEYISKTSIDSSLGAEVLSFHELHKMVPYKKQPSKLKRATKRDYIKEEIERNINIIKNGGSQSFKSNNGNITVSSYTVDHSIPGACAYIIEYDGQNIVYTGDFKKHGLHPHWVDIFIEAAKKSNPTAVITEGTNVPERKEYLTGKNRKKMMSELDVKKESGKKIKDNSDGLILVNFPAKNLDRIIMYYELAKKNNRIFAISPKNYLLLECMKNHLKTMDDSVRKEFQKEYPIPDLDDENIVLYLRRKKWGKFEAVDYKTHEREIFENYNYITYKDIRKNQEKYLLYLNFFMLNELIDIKPVAGKTLYIHSTTDPFNTEMELQDDKIKAWLKHFGIKRTETIHSSGHCKPEDLRDSLDKINAEKIFPIHTLHPETFKEFGLSGKIVLPKKGTKYTL